MIQGMKSDMSKKASRRICLEKTLVSSCLNNSMKNLRMKVQQRDQPRKILKVDKEKIGARLWRPG